MRRNISPLVHSKVRRLRPAIVLVPVLLVAACGAETAVSNPVIPQVTAASVEVAPAQVGPLAPGGAAQLTAVVRDAQGRQLMDRLVTWTSSNPAVAGVSGTGLVTGVATGSATVTAASGGRSGTAVVTVREAVVRVELSETALLLAPGQAVTVRAVLRDRADRELTDRVLLWTSSNPSVAAVATTGQVTGVSVGQALVSVTSEGVTASVPVRVQPVVGSVVVTPGSVSVVIGTTASLSATVRAPDGVVLSDRSVGWTSSNPAIATVNAQGRVTALVPGSATVTATVEGQTGSAVVTVVPVPVQTVVVTPASRSLYIGQTVQLTAGARDSAGNGLTGRPVTWSTSAPTVAVVSTQGNVVAVAQGTALISATVEGKVGTATITVSQVPVQTVSVTPATGTLLVGQTVALAASARDSAGNALTGRPVAWSTSAASVATVSAQGVVTAVALGTVMITATVEGKPGSAALEVVRATVATVDLSTSNTTFDIGDSLQLRATPRDASGNVLAGRIVTWSTGNSSVATIDRDGLLATVGSGTTQITAEIEGVRSQVVISVALNPVIQVAAADQGGCVIRSSGTLFCWGARGTTAWPGEARAMHPQWRWRQITAGYATFCGVTTDGDARCWGSNYYGQAGTGMRDTLSEPTTPQLVVGGRKWLSVHMGIYSACGVDATDRSVWCWGLGAAGGPEASPSPTPTLAPSRIDGTQGSEGVSMGTSHICGQNSAVGPWCIGRPGPELWTTVRRVTLPTGIDRLVAIGMSKTCAISFAAAAYCFGGNEEGVLNNGNVMPGDIFSTNPVWLAPTIRWKSLASGIAFHYCGIDVEDRGYCWGSNYAGQVGNGSRAYQSTPYALSDRWRQFAIGMGNYGWNNRNFTCGVNLRWQLFCWGEGESGQLATGRSSLVPVRIRIPQDR